MTSIPKLLKCLYCKKSNTEVSFNGREHVMPRFMGAFSSSPTLLNCVCDNCNSGIFSPLEVKFIEDTEEGISLQMFNFDNKSQIRIRGDKVVRAVTNGMKNPLFNEMFPFLSFKTGSNVPEISLIPQIKFKNYGTNGYIILLLDKVIGLERNSKKFQLLKKQFGNVKSKDISIFVSQNEENSMVEMERAISFVKELGIDYKEGKREALSKTEIEGSHIETEMKCKIDNEIGRVISKIAFNYFAYCTKLEGKESVLSHDNFSAITEYILGNSDLPIKQVIPSIQMESIIFDEVSRKKASRLLGHTVTFRQEGEYVISQISFLGGKIYKVVLGVIPSELKYSNFGCGHIFDPLHHKIAQLTQNPVKWGSGKEEGFGLFKLF